MTKGFVFLQLHRSQFFGDDGLNFNTKKEKEDREEELHINVMWHRTKLLL